MKKINANRIIIIGICLFLCLNMFYICQIAEATTYTGLYTETFDSLATGVNLDEGWWSSYSANPTYFSVDTFGGGKVFKFQPYDAGGGGHPHNGNLNFSQYSGIEYINFKICWQNFGIAQTWNLWLNSTTEWLSYIQLSQILANHTIKIVDGPLVRTIMYVPIARIGGIPPIDTINFSIYDDHIVFHWINGTTGIDQVIYTLFINPAYLHRFNHFYFNYISGVTTNDYKFDLLNVKFPSTSGGYSYGNLEQYNSIGTTSSFNYESVAYPYIEKLYNLPINTTIKGVDLHVSSSQYSDDPNLNHYLLYVNGYNMSYPSYFFPTTGGGYILRWIHDLVITNSKVVFEYSHPQITGYYYWYVFGGRPCSSCDLDQPYPDGLIQWSRGWEPHNGVYNPYQTAPMPDMNFVNYDLDQKFYYQTIVIAPESSPYNNKITTDSTNYTTCDTIPIYWFVSDITKTNIIKLMTNVTGYITDQSYPKDLSGLGYSGISYYNPTKAGWLSIRLYSNNVLVSSINTTIATGSCNYDMYTYPNPSSDYVPIKFYYEFNQPNGKSGLITMDTVQGYLSIAEVQANHGLYFLIDANTTTTLDMQSDGGSWFINMYVEYTTGYYTPVLSYVHLVTNPTFSGNAINVGSSSITLPTSTDTFNQRILGHHSYLGSVVSVYLNGAKIQDVSGTEIFDFIKTIDSSYPSFNNVSLILETANGSILLDYALFSVATPTVTVETPFSNYIYVFGIGIIAAFILIPLLIAGRIGIDVPTIAYSFFTGIGIVFNAITGWLPIYALFFLTVIVVAVTVWMVFR